MDAERVHLDASRYDQWGKYWGHSMYDQQGRRLGDERVKLFRVSDRNDARYVRAENATMAKQIFRGEREENPLGHKVWWILGLSTLTVAVGGVAYASTRSTSTGSSSGGTSSGGTKSSSGSGSGNPTQDAATQAATQAIVNGFEASGTQINLCAAGSAAVTAFQNAWNAASNGNPQYPTLPTNGLYDAATAAAAGQVNSSAPTTPSCS